MFSFKNAFHMPLETEQNEFPSCGISSTKTERFVFTPLQEKGTFNLDIFHSRYFNYGKICTCLYLL